MNEYYDDQPPQQAAGGGFIAQLPSILWQRKWLLIVPAVLGVIGAVAAVLVLPRQYDSTATLLVQSPTLPNDVIGTGTDSDVINRRIEALRQQVISRPKLLTLIESNGLYAKERATKPLSQIIEKMRENIALTSIDADLNTTKPEDRTIAFKLNFRYADPVKAQAITQTLMEQIVDLNSSSDVASASQTVQFLTEQGNALKSDISSLESQMSGLNARYGGILSRSGAQITSSGGSYDMQIADLTRSNQMLQMQRQNLTTADERDPIVVNAETALAAARATYSESHPDVKLAQQRLAEAKQLAAQNVRKVPVDNIADQIAFNNRQIGELRAARSRDQSQAAAAVASQSRAPVVQQEAGQLQQKLESLYKQYDVVSQRLMTAQAGARAANEQLGERLVVVDPPVVPDEPASPDRVLILAAGVVGGLGLGLILALAVELFLRPIRTPARVAQITGAPTLALVPFIEPLAGAKPPLWRRVFRNPFRRRKAAMA